MWPWVNERRNVPSVDGARTPLNRTFIAPYRSRSASSIESTPAHIAATRLIAFAAGLAPPLLSAWSTRILSAIRPGRSSRSARRTSGTRPASATRFGSSNTAETAVVA
ncbi:hypothetical protein GCM10009716_39570 [Streptomyces sodiiphilus]|uniref:Uncharacterized protein n=1 Tax=Streptomyces sodiiphilus TaxID=226217 RepID=A0ABN2PSQ8_9ACTN